MVTQMASKVEIMMQHKIDAIKVRKNIFFNYFLVHLASTISVLTIGDLDLDHDHDLDHIFEFSVS